MNLKKLLAFTTLFVIYGSDLSAKSYAVSSPNGKNVATVDDGLNITVSHDGNKVVTIKADQTYYLFPHWEQNVPALGTKHSHTGNIKGARTSHIGESILAPFYRQRKIEIEGNQLDLKLRDGFGLQVRAYDEGVAYRFYTTNKKGTVIVDETADFCFPEDAKAWLAYSTNDEKPFAMAFQNFYDETLLSEAKEKYAFLPATIESGDVKVTILEKGWYDSAKGDIMNPIPAIDLQGLIDYGREKGVSIVLWTVFNVLDEHLTEACEKYARMGIKGWKVDFMDRNDQTAVEMAERLAKTSAQYQLFLDYHGFYAPTGMSRTYPNILNYEGVFGMEEARWAKKDTDMPRYDVTFPFIRMMAGNVDFTPGAMRNGTKDNWVECYQNPVSMGTRCHQLACYVVHDSPFTMLCDAPTNYEREQACVDLITSIPDTFEETKIIQGKLGSYIIVARRNGSDWYLGGQTNWDGRDVVFSLDILSPDTYCATIASDGINANHNAEDYRIEQKNVTASDQLSLKMASGGGFLIKLIKQ